MRQFSRTWLGATAVCLLLVACGGDDGKRGAQGTEGEQGEPGQPGDEGDQGEQGDDGEKGEPGDQGAPGDEGAPGDPGDRGQPGQPGLNSLTQQTSLPVGDTECFSGGLRFDTGLDADADGVLAADEIEQSSVVCAPTLPNQAKNFNRVASFLVCTQIDAACDDDTATAAEIVAASSDGMTLIYSDSPREAVGFVDITDPASPEPSGTIDLDGEPTSVAVAGDYALVAVNTSADFVNVAGELVVVAIASQTIVETIDLGGQPDSVAVSPDGSYAAVVIENERDEDLGEGGLPQAPPGKLVVIGLDGDPSDWVATDVDMIDLDGAVEPGDPELEFVDINSDNIAVVTLQENNAIALVDLAEASVIDSFSAGTVDLAGVDATEEDALISQTESLSDVPREPDGVTWLSNEYFVTADEGDWMGGSRGFTIFDTSGNVVFTSGNQIDQMAARIGHYPDGRSENKGAEPENAEFAVYGSERYLFINSERASLVFVYDVADLTRPVFKQVLPAALGPEGALAIPSRNLLVTASEEDSREDAFRSAINIYAYGTGPATYPTVVSADRWDGSPIPFAALSGLAADPARDHILYSIEDSYFLSNRIFTLDTSAYPARVIEETAITDSSDVFAGIATDSVGVPEDVFDPDDLAAMINDDKTVNVDPEGIVVADDGGFWIASEGAGTVGEDGRDVTSLNFVFKTDENGVIEKVVTLPPELNEVQLRFGFEGVSLYDGELYVAFQRTWPGDTAGEVRIGIYDIDAETWDFAFYTLDAPESPNGGWVGLSDLTSLGDGTFMVVERDNQAGPDARIKRLYRFSITGTTVNKELVRDLMPDLMAPGGVVPEKIEGGAVSAGGDVWIVNDNDGVDDNSGEIQLLNLGRLF